MAPIAILSIGPDTLPLSEEDLTNFWAINFSKFNLSHIDFQVPNITKSFLSLSIYQLIKYICFCNKTAMIEYRKIEKSDNRALGKVMETVLIEYKAVRGGSMLGDPTCFRMFEEYTDEKSVYYVALIDGKLVGGCGVKKVPNQDDETICELQRMYILKEARGKKIGKTLIQKCIADAKKFGFKKMYLESFPQMKEAISLYQKNGFYHIDYAIGKTGHDACDIKMLKDLD